MSGYTKCTLVAYRQGTEIQSVVEDDFGNLVPGPHEIGGDVNGVFVHIAEVPTSGNFGMMRPDGKDGSKEYANYVINEDEALGNLRRIVACWNACRGLETDDLENPHLMPYVAGKYKRERDELFAMLSAAEKQRDELLTALQDMTRAADRAREVMARVRCEAKP